jgi:DNA-3-methyladenine glycosylase I
MAKQIKRCPWVSQNPLYEKYHDEEWGVPIYDDQKIFEFLVLESAQAGLSWLTILKKRENYRHAFANFNPKKIAKFGALDFKRLINDAGIIRNRLKIMAAINNAQRFLEIQKEFRSFSAYMWSFVKNKTIQHKIKNTKDYPTTIPEAEIWAKDLKKRGFKFLGPTIIYAHMQAVGMVNDHSVDCFRHKR